MGPGGKGPMGMMGPQMMGMMGKGGPMPPHMMGKGAPMAGPQMMGMMGKGGPAGMMNPQMMGMMQARPPMGPQGPQGAMPQTQPQPQPQAPAGGPLSAAALAAAPPSVQKQMLGEKLYPLISKFQPELAGKITGMMLEMDNSELLMLLESDQQLTSKVDEALRVLERHK